MMKKNAGSLLRRYPRYKISLLLCALLLLSYFCVHAAILSQASALIELEHNSVSAISNFLHLPLPDNSYYAIVNGLAFKASPLEVLLLKERIVPSSAVHSSWIKIAPPDKDLPSPLETASQYINYPSDSNPSLRIWKHPSNPEFDSDMDAAARVYLMQNTRYFARYHVSHYKTLRIVHGASDAYLIRGQRISTLYFSEDAFTIVNISYLKP